MPNEMIERVAKALFEVASKNSDLDPLPWEDQEPEEQNIGRELAHTAIAAMREPTENMMFRGHEAHRDATKGQCKVTLPGTTWRAMIDAALKETA